MIRSLLSLIPGFKKSAEPEIEAIPVVLNTSTESVFDYDSAGLFHDSLFWLIPTEQLQMTAYDDYYPAVYYAIQELPNSEPFIEGLRNIRQQLNEKFEPVDLEGFQNILEENLGAFSILRHLMTLPANQYPQDAVSGIHSDPADPLYYDLRINTRSHSIFHNEGVQLIIDKVAELEKIHNMQPQLQSAAPAQILELPAP